MLSAGWGGDDRRGNRACATSRLACSGLIVMAAAAHDRGRHRSPSRPAPGVTVQLVKGGLNEPAGFTFGPGGLIYYAERGTGRILTLNPTNGHSTSSSRSPAWTAQGERGALGRRPAPEMAGDPVHLRLRDPQRPSGVTAATSCSGSTWRTATARASGSCSSRPPSVAAVPQRRPDPLRARTAACYVFIGDGHDDANAQDRTANLQGKLLRINPDGVDPRRTTRSRAAASGPTATATRSATRSTRRPGRLWETENGPDCNDEINL